MIMSIISRVVAALLTLVVAQAVIILFAEAPAEVIVGSLVAVGAMSWAVSARIY